MDDKFELTQGKLIVLKNNKGKFYGEVEFSGKKMTVPQIYEFSDDTLNNRDCEIERNNGQIQRILLNGTELPRKPSNGLARGTNQQIRWQDRPVQQSGRSGRTGGQIFTGQKQNAAASVPVGQVKQSVNHYNVKKSKLPKDTWQIISENIDNYALKLNKYAFYDNDKKFIFYKSIKENEIIFNNPDFSGIDFDALSKRHKLLLDKLGLVISATEMQTQWRLVVGLGEESVYETSMALHPVYGFPYIPGSALKGITRSFVINEVFDCNEDLALQDDGFDLIFGSPKNSAKGNLQGAVRFFDVFPLQEPVIEPDIMNPHYSDYYTGTSNNKPPGDYYNPVPVYFLTVKDTKFAFYLGIREKDNGPIIKGELAGKPPLQIAGELMQKALIWQGMGAKTAVGYGYFT
ncbi:MAG: type III-B CRISPR module RAMP protein Cmr6 [Desulfotomaculaceae bacterium]|nr:type III-B CRISPR module RAMP protein Cmr6 [Desulfotomaculaceae bacterium]